MAKKDFSKLTQEEIGKLSKEDFQAYTEWLTGLKQENDDLSGLVKEQAEQIQEAEAVKSETKPTVTHVIGKEKVTVRVNLKKFRHLGKEGMWRDYSLADLENPKTGPGLVEELLASGSNVVTQLRTKKSK